MRRIVNILIVVALSMMSCNDKPTGYGGNEPVVPYAYVAGTWQLTHLEGQPLDDGVYAYMVMERRAMEQHGTPNSVGWRAYQLYTNLQSAYPIVSTGLYMLDKDDNDRARIEGLWDNEFGYYWLGDYYFVSVNGDTMTWVDVDDATNNRVFTRVEGIPDEIKDQIFVR